jgi:hypothetical protein
MSFPFRKPFPPEDDARMLFILERVETPLKNATLSHALGRTQSLVHKRHGVLPEYTPDMTCSLCGRIQESLERIRNEYASGVFRS